MRELTEVNLWNDIIRFLDKTFLMFSQNTITCLKYITFDIKHEGDNKYSIQVHRRDNRVPSSDSLAIVKMVLIKYYPELDIKIFRESFNVHFGMMLSDVAKGYELEEFDPFAPIGPFASASIGTIKLIAIRTADEDIIKYMIPRLKKNEVNDWILSCDRMELLESKALIMRYIKHKEEDMML